MRSSHAIGIVGLAALALGCGGSSPSLEGTWAGQDPAGNQMTFVFEDGGTAQWIVEPMAHGAAMPAETVRMKYVTDASATPAQIDFSDFDFEPLQGTTTFGIYEFTGDDAFRLDLEPAGPGEDESVRPDSFTSSTVTFHRAGAAE